MISAGQDFPGVSRDNRAARIKRARKKTLENIAKYKKADPLYARRVCPALYKKDNGGLGVKDFGDMCRGAKDKLDQLITYKPDSSLASAVRREILPEVKTENFLAFVQSFYNMRYLKFKENRKPKEYLKILQENPDDDKTLRKYNKQYWFFLKGKKIRGQWKGGFWNSLQAAIKKRFVLGRDADGKMKVYQKPATTIPIKAAGTKGTGLTTDSDLQCFASSGSTLEVYEDCTCAVEGGGTGCDDLIDAEFPQKLSAAPKGKIRARIYYNGSTKELRLIPDRDDIANRTPKDFKPIKLEVLKFFLSRHSNAMGVGQDKGTGKKLLFDFLRTSSLKDADGNSTIFRNPKGKYVVDIDKDKFYALHNTFNPKVQGTHVYTDRKGRPVGLKVTKKQYLALIKTVHAHKPIMDPRKGVPPFNILNTGCNPIKVDGRHECYLPNDIELIREMYKLVSARHKGKGIKGIDRTTLGQIKRSLGKFTKWERRQDIQWQMTQLRGEIVKMQKKESDETRIWRKITMIITPFAQTLGVLFGIFGSVVGYLTLKLFIKMRKMNANPSEAEKEINRENAARESKQRQKKITKLTRAERGLAARLAKKLPWFGKVLSAERKGRIGAILTKLRVGGISDAEAEELKELTQAERKYQRDMNRPMWQQSMLELTVGGAEMGEKVRDALLKNPTEIVMGREDQIWKALQQQNKDKMGHTTFIGGSGTGKYIIVVGMVERVQMDHIWRNEREKLVEALELRFAGRPDASEKRQEWLDIYEAVSKRLELEAKGVRGRLFAEADQSKYQDKGGHIMGRAGGVMGTQSDALERKTSVYAKELPDWMKMWTSSDGKGNTNESSSWHVQTKQQLEREGYHFIFDTLPSRLLDMVKQEKWKDWRRRVVTGAIFLDYNSPTEIAEIAAGDKVLGPLRRKYNVEFAEGVTEAVTRISIHYFGKRGHPPIDTALSELTDVVVDRTIARQGERGAEGKTITLTVKDVYEYFRTKRGITDIPEDLTKPENLEIAKELGKEVYDMLGKDFMDQADIEATKILGKEGNLSIPVEKQLLDKVLLRPRYLDAHPDVRRIALTLDKFSLPGDTEQEKANAAARFATRLHEIAMANSDKYEVAGGALTEEAIDLLIEKELKEITPVRKSAVKGADNMRQVFMINHMNQAKYDNTQRMIDVARKLDAKAKPLIEHIRSQNNVHPEQQAQMADVALAKLVQEHEEHRPLKSGWSEAGMLGTRLYSLEDHLLTEYKDRFNFDNIEEARRVAERSAELILYMIPEAERKDGLNPESIKEHAELAIQKAEAEIKTGPRDPRGPRGPRPGGGKPIPPAPPPPAAPKPDAPKPSDSTEPRPEPATKDRMSLEQIKKMLPRGFRTDGYALIVQRTMDGSPGLYGRSRAWRIAFFGSIVKRAHKRAQAGRPVQGLPAAKARAKRRRKAQEVRRQSIETHKRLQRLKRRAVLPF